MSRKRLLTTSILAVFVCITLMLIIHLRTKVVQGDLNDYIYEVNPTGYVCGTSGPSPNIVELKLAPDDNNHNIEVRIRKCAGGALSQSGTVYLDVNGVQKWGPVSYSSGVSLITFDVDPVGEKGIYARNAYQARVYSADQPTIPKHTGEVDAEAYFSTSVKALKNNTQWNDVGIWYASPSGSADGYGYYRRYLPEGVGNWDFYAEVKSGYHISTNYSYTVVSGKYRFFIPTGADVIINYIADATPIPTDTPTPIPPSEIIVDDGDSGFSSSNGWATVTSGWTQGCTGHSSDARWTVSRRIGYTNDVDWARWRPTIPQNGSYEVYYFVPGVNNGYVDSQMTRYKIEHANGQTTVTKAQRNNWCGWKSLGIFYFNTGTDGSVYLGDYTGESPQTSIVADAVKWVYRGSSPPPAPTATPTSEPPPSGGIVEAARNIIGMPYPPNINDDRKVFCGTHGPWKSVQGVCTDVAIDAYLWGTGGQAISNTCPASMWLAMRESNGGVNLEKDLYNDGQANKGRYRWNSARNSQDMRTFFQFNHQYLSCGANNWQPGDVVWFDWGGDGIADHTGVIVDTSGGKPTQMVHSPGCSNCSCQTRKACETKWDNRFQSFCVAHGRLSTTANANSPSTATSPPHLRLEMVASRHTAADVVLYAPDGTRTERIFDYGYVAENNIDFIPYTPYQDYDNDETTQWLYLYNPQTGDYRIEIEGKDNTPYTLTIQMLVDNVVVNAQTFTGNLTPGQIWISELSVSESNGQWSIAPTTPNLGTIMTVSPSSLIISDTISFTVSETSNIADLENVEVVASNLETLEGLSIPVSAIQITPNNFYLSAGQSQIIHFGVTGLALPGSIYRGNVTISSDNGNTYRLPIEFQTTVEPKRVYLPLIIRLD